METKKEEILFSWQAPEYTFYQRTKIWFIVAGIVFVTLLALMIIWVQWILAVLVVLVAVIVFQYALVKPKKIDYKITDTAVWVADKAYKFEHFTSFWISDGAGTINLIPKRKLSLGITLPIPENEEEEKELLKTLSEYLAYDEKKYENSVDKIGRALKI